jgi:ATP-dependent protease ClpP protease subunit
MLGKLALAFSVAILPASALGKAPAQQAIEVLPAQAAVISGPIRSNNLNRVAEFLRKRPDDTVVDLVIDSPGGSVFTGFQFVSVIDATRARGVHIRCFVPTVAASMAFQILLHCDERHVLDRSFLLWHRARVMMGGLFGQPMTAPALRALAYDLARLDRIILDEVTSLLDMSTKAIRYHFEHETLHVGVTLADQASDTFTSWASIPGLFEALHNPKVPRTEEDNPFSFQFGEIIYIRPGTPLEVGSK